MLPRPIFRREMRASAAGRQEFRTRVALALVFALFVLVPGWFVIGPYADMMKGSGLDRSRAARWFWAYVAGAVAGLEAFVFALTAAVAVGSSLAEERQRGTLWMLLLSRLTRLELVMVKLAGRMVPVLRSMLVGFPLVLAGLSVVDLPAPLVAEVFAALASTAIVAGSLGILASSRHETATAASREAIGWTFLWLVGTPMLARLPARSGTLLGDLLVELRRVAGWVEPSSPLSMLMDPSWLYGPGNAVASMSSRLETMLLMQAAIATAAVAISVIGLRLREPHPSSMDPHRGYRPPVGDDPIFWREYLLPRRGARVPMLVVMARQLFILLRAMVVLAIGAFFLAVALLIPIALTLAGAWLGYRAFRETWSPDPILAGSVDARVALNIYVRAGTMMLGLIPTALAASMAERIGLERARKTWDSILMTPMTGPEILGAKVRVLMRPLRPVLGCLAMVWMLGLACDALHPAGLALSTLGLVAGHRMAIALGLWGALRPGASASSINWTSGLGFLGLMLIGFLTVILPLGSTRELARLDAIGAPLPWLAGVAIASISGAMLAFAISLERRCRDRFDEWVGRPHRPPR